MDRNKLKKLKIELQVLRQNPGGIHPEKLIAIARKLGRKEFVRGKEPTYVRERQPALSPPLSIPVHGARDLKTGTAKSIIDALLDDVGDWEFYLDEKDDDED